MTKKSGNQHDCASNTFTNFSFIYYSNIDAVAVGFFWNSGNPKTFPMHKYNDNHRWFFPAASRAFHYTLEMLCTAWVESKWLELLLQLCPVTCNGTCWASLTCCSIATDWGLKAPSGRKPTHSKDAKSDSSLLFPKKNLPRRSKEFCKGGTTYIYSFSAHGSQEMMLAPLSLNHLRHVQKNNACTQCLKKTLKVSYYKHSSEASF